MKDSKIEWTDHTFNPWTGCTKVSPGCAHCYAEGWSKRSGIVEWGPGKPRRRTSEANWRKPLQWNARLIPACPNCHSAFPSRDIRECSDHLPCPSCGAYLTFRRQRVFCASLADWLDPEVPIEWLVHLLQTIHATPNLDWLLLTKRPHLWRQRMSEAYQFGEHRTEQHREFSMWIAQWTQPPAPDSIAPHNVWIGTTVEDQVRADERIPALLDIPARVRFLSCEPLLEPVDLAFACFNGSDSVGTMPGLQWLIVGGESGPKCRRFHADWARDLREQAERAGVAFFMKQMGGSRKPFSPIPSDLQIRNFPSSAPLPRDFATA